MKKQSNPPPPQLSKRPAPPPPPPARDIMGRNTKTNDLFPIELADCACGHKAEMWRTFTNWIMAGCKKCGQAAAAHNNPEQAAHDWQRMVEISNNEKI